MPERPRRWREERLRLYGRHSAMSAEQFPRTGMQMDPDYDGFVQKLRLLATFVLGALVGGAIVGLSSTDPQVSVNQQQSATTTAAPPTEPRRTTTTRRSTTTTMAREGTRDNPYPVGSTVVFTREGVDYWEIQVVKFDPDARAKVAAENQFN